MDVIDTLHISSLAAPAVAALATAEWLRRGRVRTGRARRAAWRDVAWVAAIVLFVVAMAGPLDWLGERRLMAAHMLQHLLLFSAVPGLVVFAWPGVWSRIRISATAAAGCLALGVGLIWLLHLPTILEAGLEHSWLHEGQHLLLVAAGIVLVLPLTAAGAGLGLGAAFYLVGAELLIGVLGIWLAWSPELAYPAYAGMPRALGMSPETDQALAGALLLVVEEPFLAAEFAAVFIAALGSQDADGV